MLQIKKLAAIIAFIITITIAMVFLDYSDLNFKTNLWQYSMIVISIVGIVAIFFEKKFNDNKKKKTTIIVWILALLYFIFIIISYVLKRESGSLVLLATILLISTSLNVYDIIKHK